MKKLLVPIVPAGGSGTRLWPLSLPTHPKFLLDLVGTGESLLQSTLTRLAPIASANPIVVTGTAHAEAVTAQVGERALVLAEPTPRNSMPAIAVAAAVAELADAEAVIGSFAADHHIRDTAAFHAALEIAADAATREDVLVTLGIQPDSPSTGFGYIKVAAGDAEGALAVEEFVEKPDEARAREFYASGRYLWNAGMFVVKARVLLDQLAARIPALAAGAREIAAARGSEQETATWERVWPSLTAIAIDHALAEPMAAEGLVRVVPASIGWDDVGDFASLSDLVRRLAGEEDAQSVIAAPEIKAVGRDSRGAVFGSSDVPVVLVGVQDASVVVTDRAILVVADAAAQEVGKVAKELS
ncbi:mannose-1-phosphate guanylyltransferase [Dermabacteraceae bacterium TAE3-ERU5]|nr:mannose-1-phosphate guanylyltransferase [Dermabacteraceae bacterium TAE3-ERU5]